MDFELSRENGMIKNAIRNWVSKECTRAIVADLDEKGKFPDKQVKKLAKLGFSGLTIPEEFEGEGNNHLAACLVIEEIATAYPALASSFSSSTFWGGAVISELGDQQQKQKYLSGFLRGRSLSALAIAEEIDGDQKIVQTQAIKQGSSYHIKGKKTYVLHGDQADLLICLANTAPPEEKIRLTLFCIDSETPGVTIESTDSMGFHGASFCTLHFDQVQVPESSILGGIENEGKACEQLEQINNLELLSVAATALGIARGAFDYSLQYAKERVQFNCPIGKFPALSHKFAETASRIESARLMTYQAAFMAERGQKYGKQVAMAKLIATEAAVQASMEGLQVLGGYGYTMEYDIQRYVRDAMALVSMGKNIDRVKEQIAELLGLALGNT